MLTINAIIAALSLESVSPPTNPDEVIDTVFVSDLLSNVMASCPGNCLWVTVQCHQNVIGVASLLDMQAVLLAGGSRPSPQVLAKAREVGVTVLVSQDDAFELAGKLYSLGLRGKRRGQCQDTEVR